ncbi:MAG: hypothetical protein L0I93_02640 [Atopostipes suicloacalis]|nr:hypothetical protein [Atopostipes suicloacalis]
MTKETEETKENMTEFTNLAEFNLSDGYVCDVDTGICGPAKDLENKSSKEKKNESNHLV